MRVVNQLVLQGFADVLVGAFLDFVADPRSFACLGLAFLQIAQHGDLLLQVLQVPASRVLGFLVVGFPGIAATGATLAVLLLQRLELSVIGATADTAIRAKHDIGQQRAVGIAVLGRRT